MPIKNELYREFVTVYSSRVKMAIVEIGSFWYVCACVSLCVFGRSEWAEVALKIYIL